MAKSLYFSLTPFAFIEISTLAIVKLFLIFLFLKASGPHFNNYISVYQSIHL